LKISPAALFQQYMQRYHPLDIGPYGAQLRYLVRTPSQDVLACLLFTSEVFDLKPTRLEFRSRSNRIGRQ